MAPDGGGHATDPGPVLVGHYGGAAADRLAADDRCVPRTADGDPAATQLDCLLVGWDAHEAPTVAVAAGADSGVPVVVYDPAGRPRRAARATRAGATEYVAPSALDGETVADRVVAVAAEGTDRPADAARGDDASPAAEPLAVARLFDGLPDAVIDAEFVDGVPVVRSVNEAFEELFGYDAAEVRGDPVNELVVPAEHAAEARRIDREARTAGHTITEVERETAHGRRTFLFRWLRYPAPGDGTRGFGIYTDITRRKRQQRRLRVLQRVLRHNLRNEMTAILGYVDLLAEASEPADRERYVERLRTRAESIAALGEQVQHIEEAFDEERRVKSAVNPATVAETVCARYRESHPEAAIRFDAPAAVPTVYADGLLERAVDALVENALEHHEGTPTVEVRIEPADDRWVDVVVADDGPGIPDRERQVLSGQREITQLDHSMGLGLWVARWVVEGVDGRLSFGDADDGTTVRLRLRRVRASA